MDFKNVFRKNADYNKRVLAGNKGYFENKVTMKRPFCWGNLLFALFVLLFSTMEIFAQCNIETRVDTGVIIINNRYEPIEKENVSHYGFSLTHIRFEFTSIAPSPLEIRLFILSQQKPNNIEPRLIKLLIHLKQVFS
jgi:hypothetical protein